jgi:hypothetical protein
MEDLLSIPNMHFIGRIDGIDTWHAERPTIGRIKCPTPPSIIMIVGEHDGGGSSGRRKEEVVMYK